MLAKPVGCYLSVEKNLRIFLQLFDIASDHDQTAVKLQKRLKNVIKVVRMTCILTSYI